MDRVERERDSGLERGWRGGLCVGLWGEKERRSKVYKRGKITGLGFSFFNFFLKKSSFFL